MTVPKFLQDLQDRNWPWRDSDLLFFRVPIPNDMAVLAPSAAIGLSPLVCSSLTHGR